MADIRRALIREPRQALVLPPRLESHEDIRSGEGCGYDIQSVSFSILKSSHTTPGGRVMAGHNALICLMMVNRWCPGEDCLSKPHNSKKSGS